MNAHLIYSFGEYRVDPARRELWRGGTRVPLQLKAFDCLAYLLEHRERAVGHDELIAAVWGKTEIGDNVLAQSIARARQALEDTDKEHRVIRTVTRFGYCWIMPVDIVDSAESETSNGRRSAEHEDKANGAHVHRIDATTHVDRAAPPTDESRAVADKRTRRSRVPLYIALLVVVALAAVMGRWAFNSRPVTQPQEGHTVLVLPVQVIGDDSVSWIRLGLMDLIAGHLRNAGLSVVPSDNAVALARGFNDAAPNAGELQALARVATTNLIVAAEAQALEGRWRVVLRTLHGHTPALAAQGDAVDVLDAARAAAERMAHVLGYRAVAASGTPGTGDQALDRLHQQIKAAILSDEFDTVRALVAGAATELREHPEIRYLSAYADMRAGRYKRSRSAFEALIAELDASKDTLLLARAQAGLAYTWYYTFDHATAEQHFSAAIGLLTAAPQAERSHEYRETLGSALHGRGTSFAVRDRYAEAYNDFALARIEFEAIADQLKLANLDQSVGSLKGREARYSEALTYYRRAAEAAGAFREVQLELRARSYMSSAHLNLLDPVSAQADDARIRELLAQVTNPQIKVFTGLNHARILIANGRLKEGEALIRQLLEVEGGMPLTERDTLSRVLFAGIAFVRADWAAAEREAAAALAENWDPASAKIQVQVWRTLLRAQLALQQLDAAAATASRAAAWAEGSHDAVVRFYSTLVGAEYAAAIDDPEAAVTAFESALDQARALQVPINLLDIVDAYTGFLVRTGQLEKAGIVASLAAGWADRDYNAALLRVRLHHALGEAVAWRAALERARALAGERVVPAELLTPPSRMAQAADTRTL